MFIERLNALLQERNLTRKQFLSDVKMGENQIRYWEKKNTVPNHSSLLAIASYFGVSADYLLGNTDDPGAEPKVVLSEKEKALLDLFRGLTADEQERVIEFVREIEQ